MFETTEPVERSAHDAGQAVRDREQRDDQLRRVAEARVQEAADAGAGVLGGMLGRLADQPRERHQRQRCERRRASSRPASKDEAGDDGDGREGERCPEDPPRHAASLAALCSRPSSSTGTTRSSSSRGTTSCSWRAIAQARAAGSDHDAAAFTERYRELVLGDATPRRRLRRRAARARRWRRARRVHGRRARGLASGACGARLGAGAARLAARPRPQDRRSSRTRGPTRRGSCARTSRASGSPALFDVHVFSEEVGVAQAASRRSSCMRSRELGVDPAHAMFVGDRLDADVQGAAEVGMTTVQALWFRADDDTRGSSRTSWRSRRWTS